MKAAIYARVSKDEQTKGYSLPTQLESALAYAADHGHNVIAHFCEDHTGTALDRPELNKCRELAASGAIDTLIVYDLDRLARGMAKQIIIEQEFARYGVQIEYVLTNYADSAEGRLQKNVRAVVAEYEREKIIERSIRGKKGRAKAGSVNPGRFARYGYKYVPDPAGHKGAYVIIEDEAKIVYQIYDWYVNGDGTGRNMGMGRIARRLFQMGVPTRFDVLPGNAEGKRKAKMKGYGFWSESVIRDILTAEIYAGVHYYNCRHRRRAPGEPFMRDKSEWIPIAVPPIVPRDLWEAAQQKRISNRKTAKRNTRHPYLMRGRLRCHKCGYIMTSRTDLRFDPPRSIYVCNTGSLHQRSADLSAPLCRGNLKSAIIDETIWQAIKSVLENPALIIETLEHESLEAEHKVKVQRDQLAIALRQRAEAVERRDHLVSLYARGSKARDAFDKGIAELDRMIADFDGEIASLQAQIAVEIPDPADLDSIMAFCAKIADGMENFTFEDKHEVIELLKVTALVKREDGVTALVISGYFPDIKIEAFDDKSSKLSSYSRRDGPTFRCRCPSGRGTQRDSVTGCENYPAPSEIN